MLQTALCFLSSESVLYDALWEILRLVTHTLLAEDDHVGLVTGKFTSQAWRSGHM